MPKKLKTTSKNQLQLVVLYILGFILALSSALPAYIQSSFLEQFIGLKLVSIFFIIANVLTVVSIIFFPAFIKKLSNYFTTKVVLIIHGLSLLSLTVSTDALSSCLSIILFTISTNLVWINMDMLVESFSSDASTGRTRTIYFTLINFGWICSPLLASYLISRGEYALTFFISALLTLPFFLIFLYYGRRLKDKIHYSQEKIISTFKKMWQNKNLRNIFFIALLLQLFYGSAVVYIPIYLHQYLGMAWGELGIIFSIMLIPFILIEIPAGIIADKYIGEKEMLTVGIFILSATLFLFFYITTPSFWLWTTVLFFSRVGAALIEAMRETYFFKLVGAKDVGYINIFRTTAPLGYVLGSVVALLIADYLAINYLFLILAIIMLSGFYFVNCLKDTK